MTTDWDVAIVGAGPAGLSAALMLGRCRRRVIVLDDGHPRNAVSSAAHGYLTRDGAAPGALRRIGLEEVARYGVRVEEAHVEDVSGADWGFTLRTRGGGALTARKLLLATGIVDRLPPVPGVEAFYGRTVFTCPYCDGWEFRDRPLAAYGPGREGAELALALLDWSAEVVLLPGEGGWLSRGSARALARAGVRVRTGKVAELQGRDGRLERIVLAEGPAEERAALFFHLGSDPRSDLAERLGVQRDARGAVRTGRFEETNVPGVWVAGDASHDVQWIVVAAAEGAKAAYAINRSLRKDALGRGKG